MEDAFTDAFDTALLISADSDLSAPITAICRLFPKKRVVLAFPPGRHSAELVKLASASFTIGRAKLRYSQLPDRIVGPTGYELEKPGKYR